DVLCLARKEPLMPIEPSKAAFPQIAQTAGDRKVPPHERGGRGAEQDLPTFGRLAYPRRLMDGDTDVTRLADHGLTGVQAHPHPDLHALWPALPNERLLGL